MQKHSVQKGHGRLLTFPSKAMPNQHTGSKSKLSHPYYQNQTCYTYFKIWTPLQRPDKTIRYIVEIE